jgi:hypothetical protein
LRYKKAKKNLFKDTLSFCLAMIMIATVMFNVPSKTLASENHILDEYNMHVLTNVISGVESYGQRYSDNRRWDAYANAYANTPKEKSITLGWAQNYGDEGRKLLQLTLQNDPSLFRQIDTAGIESDLRRSWVTKPYYQPTSKSQKGKVIKKLISSSAGKKAQDELFAQLMDRYVVRAIQFGIPKENVKAIMMWCECEHLGGLTPVQRVFRKCRGNYTVENIMMCLKEDQSDRSNNNQIGDKIFWSRHTHCAEWVNRYARNAEKQNQSTQKPPTDVMKPEPIKPSAWNPTGTATVAVDKINLRSTPGGKIIGTLDYTNRFEVNGEKDGKWVKINVNGIICWVSENVINYDGQNALKEYTAEATTAVYVHSGASIKTTHLTAYPILAKGNRVRVIADEGYTLKVIIAGKHTGYVSKKYLKRM